MISNFKWVLATICLLAVCYLVSKFTGCLPSVSLKKEKVEKVTTADWKLQETDEIIVLDGQAILNGEIGEVYSAEIGGETYSSPLWFLGNRSVEFKNTPIVTKIGFSGKKGGEFLSPNCTAEKKGRTLYVYTDFVAPVVVACYADDATDTHDSYISGKLPKEIYNAELIKLVGEPILNSVLEQTPYAEYIYGNAVKNYLKRAEKLKGNDYQEIIVSVNGREIHDLKISENNVPFNFNIGEVKIKKPIQ